MTGPERGTRPADAIGDLLRLVNELLEENRIGTAMLILDMALLEWQIERTERLAPEDLQ